MDAVVKSPENSSRPIEKVTIHPLVLLSTVDHYIRLSQCPLRRVVGVLLGSSFEGTVNVSNSYPVPFDEDDMDPSAWFLDLNYVEKMFSMFKKIYDKEQIVGWYSTGPELQENDMDIHSLFHKYVPNPVLVIVDVLSTELGIPTKACYCDVEEVKENATTKTSQKVFVDVPFEVAADDDAEEIRKTSKNGAHLLAHDHSDEKVESLSRDVEDTLEAKIRNLEL